jgi:hypothetical protein
MAPRPKGEESEALNRAAFASLGQKQRAFEPLCLSLLFDASDFPMLYTHRYDKNLSASDGIRFKNIS